MATLRVALMQLYPANTPEMSLQIAKSACLAAANTGADIALFPEMWSTGYTLPRNASALKALSISADDEYVQEFARLAAELNMAIGITFLERHEPRPLNSFVLLDRYGKEVLHYSKVHICAFGDERVLSPGSGFATADLDIGEGTVRIGAMICFDREFPESARILMLQDAEVILMPNACPLEINRLAALRTRAYENKVAVAACSYPEGHPDCNGHSVVFDGIAWKNGEAGARDMCVFEAPGKAGIYIAKVDLDALRTYRANEAMGSRYRQPQTYGLLQAMPEECT